MAIDTLGANALASNSVTTAKIAADAVTSAKIPADAVVATDIADGSITTAKIANNAVTSAKALNLGRRNIIINGAMRISQRGTSSTGQGASDLFLLDRFKLNTNGNSAGRYTVTQTADGPSGFANCMKLDCTTADTSIAAAERFFIEQKLEGQDLQQIKKGTSDAEQITVSFYVKGNASATYVLGLYESDNSRAVGSQFSVTTSWTRVVVTFPADTTGALDDDNAESLSLRWYLHAGSNYTSGTLATTWASASASTQVGSGTTSFFDSTNRTFFITGVQMEVGDAATDFEHRSVGEELALCQRYYHQANFTAGPYYGGGALAMYAFNASEAGGTTTFPVTMRAAPTVRLKDAAGNIGGMHRAAVGNVTSGVAVGWSGNADANTKGISQVYKTNAWATGNMLIGGYEAVAEL